MAPTNGSAAPHSRFWIAIASENTSRPKPSSCVIGWRKKPIDERGPKVRIAIRQPHAMRTAGGRQPSADEVAGETVFIVPPSLRRMPYRRDIIVRQLAARGENPLRGRGRRPQHRLLDDRQVERRGEQTERHREPPHHIVRARALV